MMKLTILAGCEMASLIWFCCDWLEGWEEVSRNFFTSFWWLLAGDDEVTLGVWMLN